MSERKGRGLKERMVNGPAKAKKKKRRRKNGEN
jgi:hypothetical protein